MRTLNHPFHQGDVETGLQQQFFDLPRIGDFCFKTQIGILVLKRFYNIC